MKVYNSIKNFLDTHNYLIYIFLTALILGACFFEFFIFIIAGFVLILSLFVNPTDVLGLLLFVYPFERIFSTVNFLFEIIKCLLILNLFVVHIITSVKNKTSCSLKIIIGFAVYCIYIILPMHTTNLRNLILLCAELCLIYIIYKQNVKINHVKLIEIFSVSLIVMCFFGTLRPFSDRLKELITYNVTGNNVFRFIPFSNFCSNFIALALFLLCIVKYFEKINTYKFVGYSSILFMCGIMTISRNFAFSVFLGYVVFSILYLLKYKKKAVKPLCLLAVGFSLALLVSMDKVIELLARAGGDQVFEVPDEVDTEFFKKVFSGEIRFDPGRKALWELYLKDIMSSSIVLLFGRGIGRPLIGQMMPHNMFIYLLWVNGIFGLIIYFVVILLFINFKKINLKTLKDYLYLLIFIIPLVFNMFIDNHPMGKLLFVFLMIMMQLKTENEVNENNEIKTKENKSGEFTEENNTDQNNQILAKISQEDKKIEINQ